jgi:hypothetical protein
MFIVHDATRLEEATDIAQERKERLWSRSGHSHCDTLYTLYILYTGIYNVVLHGTPMADTGDVQTN